MPSYPTSPLRDRPQNVQPKELSMLRILQDVYLPALRVLSHQASPLRDIAHCVYLAARAPLKDIAHCVYSAVRSPRLGTSRTACTQPSDLPAQGYCALRVLSRQISPLRDIAHCVYSAARPPLRDITHSVCSAVRSPRLGTLPTASTQTSDLPA